MTGARCREGSSCLSICQELERLCQAFWPLAWNCYPHDPVQAHAAGTYGGQVGGHWYLNQGVVRGSIALDGPLYYLVPFIPGYAVGREP